MGGNVTPIRSHYPDNFSVKIARSKEEERQSKKLLKIFPAVVPQTYFTRGFQKTLCSFRMLILDECACSEAHNLS